MKRIALIISKMISLYKKVIAFSCKMMNILFVKYRNITMKVLILAALIIIQQIFSYLSAGVFYYADKDTSKIFTERRRIKQVGVESEIQATLRKYLAGSNNYRGRIPFSSEVNLLNISHNNNNKVLILNWNSYFYKALENKNFDQDISMLLQTIAKNYKIDTVYFLVEGANLNGVFWNDFDLGDGISSTDLLVFSTNVKKNIKK